MPSNTNGAVVFGWFVFLFILPVTVVCLIVTGLLLKELYIFPTFNTQQIRHVLKLTALGTCAFFSINNVFVLIEELIVLTTNKDAASSNKWEGTLMFLDVSEKVCRNAGILLMFGYFLARLYLAFQYDMFYMLALYGVLLLWFIIFEILAELYPAFSVFFVLMTLYSIYAVFVMYLFVRKLFEMIILRSRDLANTYYLMPDNDTESRVSSQPNAPQPSDQLNHDKRKTDATDITTASKDFYELTLSDKNNAKLIQAITRSCLLSVFPVVSSLVYHFWQLYPLEASPSDFVKHQLITYVTYMMVVADDLCAVLCIFLNWNFTNKWYKLLCKRSNDITQRCCLRVVKKKLEKEQFEFIGVEFDEPLQTQQPTDS
ncbi:hypothetical protein RFI_28084 [Reticulomyxa filosa]|uniref:Uncharacterized protein n=1 Tax=Reticulomyxa filosa TaxID=46433 RepID=X6M6Q0_RETFI|nr:hypothetical protein RFI_28084 [Reticulomyxa filosa]|eukprot:ETO09301.1 hypothetical protein RFI_28084 [Reticulomyxa filosa]